MIITIEGLDRTGKSTLAKELALRLHGRVIHNSKPERHPLDEYLRPIQARGHKPLILDRAHIGERVWPYIFDRKTAYDLPMHRYVELVLRSQGGITVYAQRERQDLERALLADNEPISGIDIDIALDLFENALLEGVTPTIRYEHLLATPAVDHIIQAAQRARADVREPLRVSPFWIGSPRPWVLLVGEQVSKPDGSWIFPFVPFKGTSGHFLMKELGRLPFSSWKDVAITNALRITGQEENIVPLWDALGQPPIVALGKTAERVLENQLLVHNSIPHPQYWRRFKRSEGEGSYAKLIMEATR